ncbi:hypothetical protein FHW67_000350 [Herbaspirillum sp. Sphag1AN]|uniref:hypothetical protein n=1 Tax=unclassified Herbaspirillum TaxID=2624150 RepID=UPI001616A12C|nr:MULTISPECIES: hypothetical protein [unclassified Herbaspirillum]MBB3211115.1 hypothetical protein [Herbaspirillum sp. Sphag1AN]MBB3244744.1 hypothetical protein [Herbaspirillum sp. Sphag64]
MAQTYNFTGGHFDYVDPDYPQYTTALNTQGSFAVPKQLQGNLKSVDITSTITDWSFSDGYLNYDKTNSTLNDLVVSTDDSGEYLIQFSGSVTYTSNQYMLVMYSLRDPFSVMAPVAEGHKTIARISPVGFSIYPA